LLRRPRNEARSGRPRTWPETWRGGANESVEKIKEEKEVWGEKWG